MLLRKGRFTARVAATAQDVEGAQALRHRAFKGGEGQDRDDFDPLCEHVLVEAPGGELAACFRLREHADAAAAQHGYTAQFYALEGLAALPGPMVEMGRFCIRPGAIDPDILRLAWGALTRRVEAAGVQLLFGCASFAGAAPKLHRDALALLRARHLGPAPLRPAPRASRIFPFARSLARVEPDPRRAVRGLPPLLRSYLAMGGWVSDHAVIDTELDTLHVFTGLEIAAIPASRKRLLHNLAAPDLDAEPVGG